MPVDASWSALQSTLWTTHTTTLGSNSEHLPLAMNLLPFYVSFPIWLFFFSRNLKVWAFLTFLGPKEKWGLPICFSGGEKEISLSAMEHGARISQWGTWQVCYFFFPTRANFMNQDTAQFVTCHNTTPESQGHFYFRTSLQKFPHQDHCLNIKPMFKLENALGTPLFVNVWNSENFNNSQIFGFF